MPEALTAWAAAFRPPLDDPWSARLHVEEKALSVLTAGRLLLPAIVAFEGGYFLADRFSPENVRHWRAALPDITAVEQMINHTHAYDLFGDEATVEDEYVAVAKLLQRTWSLTLPAQFPDLKFEVSYWNTKDDYGPTVPFFRVA